MTKNNNYTMGEMQIIQERLEHLERVNRWHMSALDILASMGDMHGDAEKKRDPNYIFDVTCQYLKRFVDFEATGFMVVDEEDAGFELVSCEPRDKLHYLNHRLGDLIKKGEFAWALNHNRAIETTRHDDPKPILLHVLASRTRVRGMFVGLLHENARFPSAATLNLLSVILNNSAYALESSALYKLISDHNRNLESAIEKRTRELEHQYGHDSLTQLPNRLLFQDRVAQAMARAQRNRNMVAILLLDLDMFKRVNDTLGHAAGDQLLVEVAERLTRSLRSLASRSGLTVDDFSITCSRLGGDEFGILITDLANIDPITRVVKRVIEAFSGSIVIGGHEIYMTGSIGISLYPSDGEDTESLLKNADVAMYHAKRQGRNNYQFYSQEMNASSYQQLLLENQLRRALNNDEFLLYYQPKVDAVCGRIGGMEALIRWNNPEVGIIPPNEFIPIAEYSGLITAIGRWVLRTACAQTQHWISKGFCDLRIAVNLCAQQFRQPDLVDEIVAILGETRLDPRRLELEITESTIMEDIDASVATMHRLHELGIRLSIDDFGTGYSSLSYLKRFPIDTLKIDRSFVRDITTNGDDAAIVTATIAMARSMGLIVVAEGVETEEQLTFLRGLNCDEIQGYLIKPPIPADQVMPLLHAMGTS